MRIPCPTASAGDSHINHRGGESKQLLWCVRRGRAVPTSHPSMSLLALSRAAFPCPGHPEQQFLDHQANHPLQHRNCHSLPSLSPSPAVMEKGCHCPQVPQEGGCALALREEDEGLFLAQTQHPHPSLAQHRAGSGPGCCPCCFQHLKSVLLMQNEHKGRAKAPGSALQLSSLKHSHGSENPLAWFYFLPTIQSSQSKLELEKTQISPGF